MDSRVVLKAADGTLTPLACEVTKGRWWSDNWITPALQLRLAGLPLVSGLAVSGYGPGFAPSQIENAITISAADSRVVRPLEWGRTFEATLAFRSPCSGDLVIDLSVLVGLSADGLDGRERGVVVTRVVLAG